MVDLSKFRAQRSIFSEEHHQYRESVRRFIESEIEPFLKQWESVGQFDSGIFRKAGQAGLLCPHIPQKYGGGGGDVLHQVILQEEQGYSVMGAHLEAGLSTDLASYIIYRCGTEQQKHTWLPKCAAGETIVEVAVTEPSAGSDLSNVRTVAKREGSDYRISGSKLWISNGTILDMSPVLCRVGGFDGPFAMFLVDSNAEGFSRGPNMETMARGSGSLSELFLDNVRVPADRLLGGEEGRGLQQAMSVISLARAAMCARWLAQAERVFASTLDFVRERKVFGQRVFDLQNTQFKLAEVKTELAVARSHLDEACLQLANGSLGLAMSAGVKLRLTEMENRVVDECLQLFGGAGYMQEYPISRLYTGARLQRIYAGTSELQKVAIARSL